MACDPNTLIDQAKCIDCTIPPGMRGAVMIELLCQILANGGTGGGGATKFIQLTDVPQNYTGAANHPVVVNSAATGLVFDANITFDTAGNVTAQSFTTNGAKIHLNNDGSASFANGAVTIATNGNFATSGNVQTNGTVTCTNLDLGQGIVPGVITGFWKITQNQTGTATFNTNNQNEHTYDDDVLPLANLTINLPATTVAGQVLRYTSGPGATSVTVNGTVSIGAGVTTLAANATVSWQAIDGAGTFIQLP